MSSGATLNSFMGFHDLADLLVLATSDAKSGEKVDAQ